MVKEAKNWIKTGENLTKTHMGCATVILDTG